MLNSKFNVYKIEWLNLVFANRNQLYGAYELRKSYSSTLIKAMLAASAFFIGIITFPFIYKQYFEEKPVIENVQIPDDVLRVVEVKVLPEKSEARQEVLKAKRKVTPVKIQTKKFVHNIRVVPQSQTHEDIPTVKELTASVIGSVNSSGLSSAINASPVDLTQNTGEGSLAGEGDRIYTTVESFPMFPGGMDAFYKYLGRNMRYPSNAVENEVSGKVVVSFVIEPSGDLSNIKVLSGIGYGCDEEAMRVLKSAPLWIPGEQNGQKVRVQYTMPIVFHLGN